MKSSETTTIQNMDLKTDQQASASDLKTDVSDALLELIRNSRITDWHLESTESGIIAKHSSGAVFEGSAAEFKECRRIAK